MMGYDGALWDVTRYLQLFLLYYGPEGQATGCLTAEPDRVGTLSSEAIGHTQLLADSLRAQCTSPLCCL